MGGTERNQLILGWQVDDNLDPVYWTRDSAPTPGGQTAADLIAAPPADLAYHAAIVAQSGSGKSFFLGRLIEELLLRTKARCVILDPNADFRQIAPVIRSEELLTDFGLMDDRRVKLIRKKYRID